MVSLKSGWTSRARAAWGGGGGGLMEEGRDQPAPGVVGEREGEVDVGREGDGALETIERGVRRIDQIAEIEGAALAGVAGLDRGGGEEEPAGLLDLGRAPVLGEPLRGEAEVAAQRLGDESAERIGSLRLRARPEGEEQGGEGGTESVERWGMI